MTTDQAVEIVKALRVGTLFDNRLHVSIRVLSVVPDQYINILIWIAGTSRRIHTPIVGKGERKLIQEIFDQCLQILSTELYEQFPASTVSPTSSPRKLH